MKTALSTAVSVRNPRRSPHSQPRQCLGFRLPPSDYSARCYLFQCQRVSSRQLKNDGGLRGKQQTKTIKTGLGRCNRGSAFAHRRLGRGPTFARRVVDRAMGRRVGLVSHILVRLHYLPLGRGLISSEQEISIQSKGGNRVTGHRCPGAEPRQ